MNKYVTKTFAKKMLLAGALLWVITFVASFTILWNAYGLAGSSFGTTAVSNENELTAWSIVAKINLYVQYAAYVILVLGILNLLISSRKKRP